MGGRGNSWWVSEEHCNRHLAELKREADAIERSRALVLELVEAVGPIQNWGGEEPGDRIVYLLVDELRKAYGGWSSEPAYRKARIPEKLRAEVYERDGHRCITCGAEDDLSLDHIYPERLGGPTTADNLRTLCRSCNSRKGVSLSWG